jgi:hypothetical protein
MDRLGPGGRDLLRESLALGRGREAPSSAVAEWVARRDARRGAPAAARRVRVASIATAVSAAVVLLAVVGGAVAGVVLVRRHLAEAAAITEMADRIGLARARFERALIGRALVVGRTEWTARGVRSTLGVQVSRPEGGVQHSLTWNGPCEGDATGRSLLAPLGDAYCEWRRPGPGQAGAGTAGTWLVAERGGASRRVGPRLSPFDGPPVGQGEQPWLARRIGEATKARFSDGPPVTVPLVSGDGSRADLVLATVIVTLDRTAKPEAEGQQALEFREELVVAAGESPVVLLERGWLVAGTLVDQSGLVDRWVTVTTELGEADGILYARRRSGGSIVRDPETGQSKVGAAQVDRTAVADDVPALAASWPLARLSPEVHLRANHEVPVHADQTEVPPEGAFDSPAVEALRRALAVEEKPTVEDLSALFGQPRSPRAAGQPPAAPLARQAVERKRRERSESAKQRSAIWKALGRYVAETGCFPPDGLSLPEALAPYVADPSVFERPDSPGVCGYALAPALRGRPLADLASLPRGVVYESDDGSTPLPAHRSDDGTTPQMPGEIAPWTPTDRDGSEAKTRERETKAHLRALAEALLRYAADHEGRFPPAEVDWEEAVAQYASDGSVFLAPTDDARPSYALNPKCRGALVAEIAASPLLLLAESDDGATYAYRSGGRSWGIELFDGTPSAFIAELPRRDGSAVITAFVPGQPNCPYHLGSSWDAASDERRRAYVCERHLLSILTALQEYALDHRGLLPSAEADWEEALLPYVASAWVLRCPASAAGHGYALNPRARGASVFGLDGVRALVYDSDDGVRVSCRHGCYKDPHDPNRWPHALVASAWSQVLYLPQGEAEARVDEE